MIPQDSGPIGRYPASTALKDLENAYHRSHQALYLDIYHPGKEIHNREVRPNI